MTEEIKIINKKNMQEFPEQEDVWDSIAIPWGKYVVKKIRIVEEFLRDKKGKVIDLGCGSGRNMIPNKDIKYCGIDFSSGQLMHAMNYAEEQGINAKFFKLRADRLSKKDFKNEMFDYGLFIGSLHCLETKKERLNALKEFYRVLKSGAEALISIWNSEDKRFQGCDKDIYMSWREEGVAYMRYYYLYDRQEFLDLLKSVGFKVLEIYEPREHERFSKKNWIARVSKV